MKGYQSIISKTQMLQYNNHYNFIHLIFLKRHLRMMRTIYDDENNIR